MEIKQEELPRHRIKVNVKLSEVEVAEYYSQALRKLAPTVHLDGFRPGHAPLEMVKQKIGEVNLREEAYSLAVRDAWRKVVNELKKPPIEDPQVEIVVFMENHNGELEFQFDTQPEIKVGKWQDIKIKDVSESKIEVSSPEDVIDSLRKGHATQLIKEGSASEGDRLMIDFEGFIKGVKQDALSARDFPLLIGQKIAIPGFEEKLIGAKKGEMKKFPITFPPNHFDKNLQGKTVDFEVSVKEVYQLILPEVNDAFAAKFGHKTVAQLKKAIEKDINNQVKAEKNTRLKAAYLEKLEKIIEVDVPQSLIKREMDRLKKDWLDFLSSRNLSPSSWLEKRGVTMEQMEKSWQSQAEHSVKIGLALAKIANEQKRELKTNEDFEKFLEELVEKSLTKRK